MKLSAGVKILVVFLCVGFWLCGPCCRAEEEVETEETAVVEYHDPGNWQIVPEESLFFSIDGLINSSYFKEKIDTSVPPLDEFIANNDMKGAAEFCAGKSTIRRGMYSYMLTASSPAAVKIEEFNFEVPPYCLYFKFASSPQAGEEESGYPVFVISEKPDEKIAVLTLEDVVDEGLAEKKAAEFRHFFASDTNFIPIYFTQMAANQQKDGELEKFIAEKMQLTTFKRPVDAAFKDLTFISGGFNAAESFLEDFSAVVFRDGTFKILPNYSFENFFTVNGRLYFCGVWSYPETGWHDYIIYRVESDTLTKIFSEDAYSD